MILVFLLLGGAVWQPGLAQSEEEYFEQTGHRVTGEFLLLYRAVPNPIQLYGYPITDAFQDPDTGYLVQYFEKTRFELQPDQPPGRQARLAPLGEYLYVAGERLPEPNQGACRQFPQTGFQVCYAFLDFFNANGGLLQFGAPISNREQHDGLMVQYFQYARLEWRPDYPANRRVIVSDLGRTYFSMHREDPRLLLPDDGGDTIKGILTLSARAYPAVPVTARQGSQTVYVVVQDQRLLPIANARASLLFTLPSGRQLRYEVPELTDRNGLLRFTFPFDSPVIGVAKIQVIVQRENLSTQTVTSFRIWW
ncbi:MAG: hypothetical protein ACKOC5_09195 [Chloroflexota bacterium]